MLLRGLSTAKSLLMWGAGLAACVLVGCVNRGMHAPEDDGGRDQGRPGDGAADRKGSGGLRVDATGDRLDGGAGGTSVVDASGDAPGSGGAGGTAGRGAGGTAGSGVGGSAGRGAGGSAGTGAGGAADAGAADVPRICASRFNFESGNRYGAFINTGFQTAFTGLSSTSDAACGSGALRVDTTLSPSSDKGEVILPLGATEDVSGKTFSISVKTAPAAPPNAYVIVFLVPSYAFVTAFSPIPSAWTASTVTLPSGTNAGTRATTAIAVQVLGRGDSLAGALFLDEIDLR